MIHQPMKKQFLTVTCVEPKVAHRRFPHSITKFAIKFKSMDVAEWRKQSLR